LSFFGDAARKGAGPVCELDDDGLRRDFLDGSAFSLMIMVWMF